MVFRIFFLFTSLYCSLAFSQQQTYRIEGKVLERGTRTPMGGINIFILPAKIRATTSADGSFSVEGVPEGKFQWVVNVSGYEKLELDDEVSVEKTEPRKLYVEKASYEIYETTIYDKAQKRDDTTRSLKAKEAVKLPGSFNDPIKAVQNLPGVNRPSSFQSNVLIQGSAPQDTRYTVDSHEVPLIFHFGGFTSVTMPEALDRVDYLSAGYGPEYGRAIGGLINAHTREAQKDRFHGMGYVDIFNSGGLIEGPLHEGPTGKKAGFFLGARRSYIGEVLRLALKGNSAFDFTVAPRYSDLLNIYDLELTERDYLKVTSIGSLDELEFLFKEPVGQNASLRGRFAYMTAFFRIIPQWTHKHSSITTSRYSFGFGRDWIRVDLGENYFFVRDYALTARGELERKMFSTWTSYWGFDNRYAWANVDLRFPAAFFGQAVTMPVQEATIFQRQAQVGAYWRNVIKPEESRFTFMPNMRGEYFSLTKETLALPRLASRYSFTDSFFLRAATGMYAQSPIEQEIDPTFGNPDLKANRAIHGTLGAEKDFREGTNQGLVLSGGGFYKHLYNLVVPSKEKTVRNNVSVPEKYNNKGTGKAYGAEAMVKYNSRLFDFPITNWISYTLSRSTRQVSDQPENLFQYDQTHLLTVIGSVEFPRNWILSSRFRYATGNPTTPIVGSVFDSDSDAYTPIRGKLYSERVEPFYQLDVRVDKKWIFNTWILSAYLDVQNATNRRNIEAVRYSYDYSKSTTVSGLPIIPILGLKGEF